MKTRHVPDALGPAFLDDCELGSEVHRQTLLAKLTRLTNLQVQFNFHTAERWVRFHLPTRFDKSDEFITLLELEYVAHFERAGWRVEVVINPAFIPGSMVYLLKPDSEGAAAFDAARGQLPEVTTRVQQVQP